MGREKKILLGLLGLLAGVFVGVLSLKLLVPRPPAGAGPDIRTDVAAATVQERVEPPAPTPGGWDFAAAPPLVPDPPAAPVEPPPALPAEPEPALAAADSDSTPRPTSRFAAAEPPPPLDAPPPDVPPLADPDVAPASWQRPAADAVPLPPLAAAVPPRPATPVAGVYLVQPGDSWWSLAERAYGDGRLYRALFAWNRTRDPRISLAPGTRLDVPPLVRLEAAWPRLLPAAAPR